MGPGTALLDHPRWADRAARPLRRTAIIAMPGPSWHPEESPYAATRPTVTVSCAIQRTLVFHADAAASGSMAGSCERRSLRRPPTAIIVRPTTTQTTSAARG